MFSPPLTHLVAAYSENRVNVRLRFGEPLQMRPIGDSVTHYWFAAGQRFGVLWWVRHSPRKQFTAFAVAEALGPGQTGYRLPCITPAVHVHAFLHCRCIGKERGVVGRADELLRQLQQSSIDLCIVPPVYYRLVAQALRVGQQPRRLNRQSLIEFLQEQPHEN